MIQNFSVSTLRRQSVMIKSISAVTLSLSVAMAMDVAQPSFPVNFSLVPGETESGHTSEDVGAHNCRATAESFWSDGGRHAPGLRKRSWEKQESGPGGR
ncbi:unnamed protein product [Amoebophrya sp. A120]|nr:unnamed protein product [Amoebophrya sp. A120]|eukprot:GSA120T00018892001.1